MIDWWISRKKFLNQPITSRGPKASHHFSCTQYFTGLAFLCSNIYLPWSHLWARVFLQIFDTESPRRGNNGHHHPPPPQQHQHEFHHSPQHHKGYGQGNTNVGPRPLEPRLPRTRKSYGRKWMRCPLSASRDRSDTTGWPSTSETISC